MLLFCKKQNILEMSQKNITKYIFDNYNTNLLKNWLQMHFFFKKNIDLYTKKAHYLLLEIANYQLHHNIPFPILIFLKNKC